MLIRNKKYIILVLILAFVFSVFVFQAAEAYSFDPGSTIKNLSTLPTSKVSPGERIILIVQVALMFMGAIVVLLLVYGGFLYATAGGNQENVGKAKKIIVWTIIGMVFVLGSYAITGFLDTGFKTVSTPDTACASPNRCLNLTECAEPTTDICSSEDDVCCIKSWDEVDY